jgi:hypothetical protein
MAFVGLLAAGCSSTAEPRVSPTVQTAPQTAAPTTPVPTTAATTLATSTTLPPTSAAVSSAEADRAEIARILESTSREFQTQKVNRLFDGSKFPNASSQYVEGTREFLQEYWTSKRAEFGSVLEYRVINISIQGDSATAVVCTRNDIQVFDSAGTETPADDTLVDGSLDVRGASYQLERSADAWTIADTIEGDSSPCQSAF